MLVGELRSIILLDNILLVIIQMLVSMQKRYRIGREKMKQIVFRPRIVPRKLGEQGKICIVRPKAGALSLVLLVVCIIMQLVSVLAESVKQKRVRSSDLNPGNCVANYS